MKPFLFGALLVGVIGMGACSRPAEVRRVATLSKPVAVEIQRSGDRLQSLVALQTEKFERQAALLANEEARARAHSASTERDWRLDENKSAPRIFALLREGDAEILADPLAGVAKPAPPTAIPPQTIDLGGLKKTIAGLDRMSGRRRGGLEELVAFAWDVNVELRKLEDEVSKAPAGGAGAVPPTDPPQP
jgi:hypothetical protein